MFNGGIPIFLTLLGGSFSCLGVSTVIPLYPIKRFGSWISLLMDPGGSNLLFKGGVLDFCIVLVVLGVFPVLVILDVFSPFFLEGFLVVLVSTGEVWMISNGLDTNCSLLGVKHGFHSSLNVTSGSFFLFSFN